MDSTVSVYSQIASCTTSDSDYTLNCEAIFKELGNNSKTYIKNFLTSISTIILDDTYPPLQQFLTLQLLAHATETKNQELIKQLANSKEFLNRLFHDAQYDYEEPLEEKGKCYFHDEPENTLKKLGKDYIRLVLEAFSYWSKEYGTPNTNDPLHCFYAVFTALCGKTQLPTTYKFITKNPQVRRYVQKPGRVASRTNSISRSPIRNNSRSPSPTSIIGVDVSRDESIVSMRAETNEAFGQVLNCVPSEQRYEKYSAEIFDLVERPSFDYNKKLLRAITALIKGTNYSWTYKFYTLYLLTQITETKDKVFVTQLVRESKLLNELYRQAKKKGRSDVKETAEEREYKRDFHKLTLEAIKFWHLSFGSSDINSPFYSFTYLYDMLKKDVKFPSQNEFQFIKARVDRQSMSSIKLESRTSSRKTTKTAQDLSNDNDSIMRLVKTYISSGIAFRDDSSNIASILIKQPKIKSENYLQGTYKILNSIELKPNQRFYALYLLARTAETKNNTFISALAESKTLLDLILKQALFEKNEPAGKRGSRLFSNRPSSEEAVIGSNYVQLAQETIRFFGRNYGVDNSRHPNSIFMTMAVKLEKEVSMDRHDHFVGKDLKTIDDNSMKKFEITPFHGYAQEHSQVRSSPVSSSLSKSKGQDLRARPTSLADLDKGLKDLNYAKTVLLSFLQDNERKNQENTDLVDNMVQDIADCYKSQVHPHLELLMNSSGHDNYKTIIYQEGKIVNDLDQLLIHYKTTKTSFAEIRDRMIPILATTATSQASSPSRLNRPAFLDTRLESSGLRMGMGALHNSDPVVHSPSSRFSRSPAKARTEVIRPVAVSDNDFLSRHEALLGRSNRRAETAHVPNKPSIGSIRSFDHHEIPFTESLTAVPEHRPVESLRAIEPFEKLSLAFDEKIKAAEQMRISRSSISQQPLQTDFQHNKRSSLEMNYVSPNRSVIGGSTLYLFPENNRSYIKPSSLGSVAPPLETSMFVPGRSLYEVDHAARPQGSMLGTSGVRRFEGLGTTTSATQNPSYMHSKLGGITLGTKADSPVGRSYLFSNSVFGNRQNM